MSTSSDYLDSKRITDFLFYFQLIAASVFVASQLSVMRESISGVSITWFGLWLVFLLINLFLSIAPLRRDRNRVSKQTFVLYLAWVIAMAFVFAFLLWQGAAWTKIDTVTAMITVMGSIASIVVARIKHLPITDPMVQASFAVLCKSVPQLTLVWMIIKYGGDGISPYVVVLGHVTISLRLAQLWYASLEGGWDRNRKGIAIGELSNELTWIVATVVWFIQ
jgi:hypothetical protein